MADCCYAGTIGDELRRFETEKAYACLNSAPGTITSADSWAYTDALIDGFGGSAYVDTNRDGEISLGELKGHVFNDM